MRKANEPWLNRNGEFEAPMIGPVEIPWEIRTFVYVPKNGSFRTVQQKISITKRTHQVVAEGYIDKNIQVGADKVARHISGSPVFTYAQVREIYDESTEKRIPINMILLQKLDEWGISVLPDFSIEVHEGEQAVLGSLRQKVIDGHVKMASLGDDKYAETPKRKPRKRLQPAAKDDG